MDSRTGLAPKILVTVVIGGLTYLITRIFDMSDGTGITLGVVVASAFLIVQFVMDLDRRLEILRRGLTENREETRELVSSSFARINEATELFSVVETSSLRTDSVSQLVQSASRVADTGPEIVRSFAQEEIGRLAAMLDSMSRNVIDRDGEDHDWIITLTQCSTGSIDAISTSMDHGFWNGETGLRYLRAQREAIQTRGVRIRRLFLVASPDGITGELRQQCDEQQILGIDARILVLESKSASVRLGAMNDFVVFDGELSYEVAFDMGGINATTTLHFQAERVRLRIERFNELWEAATTDFG
ncbi:DUF6879 family protein [Streptomyces sp. NPDC047072]|uniref:DUF6879 family protein n=1 Tax=Streptomyces sp. NPDC047072 TaxID=3154809 RepID=UPI0033F77E3A